MIASLMMYQRPQLVNAHAEYWNIIRQNLQDAGMDSPVHLSQDTEGFSVWKSPGLVLSQTCGMPYRTWLHEAVELVGTPDFGVLDCPPGYYRSALIVRAEDPRMQAGAGATSHYGQRTRCRADIHSGRKGNNAIER